MRQTTGGKGHFDPPDKGQFTEGAVSSFLYDLVDVTAVGDDLLELPFADLFSVYSAKTFSLNHVYSVIEFANDLLVANKVPHLEQSEFCRLLKENRILTSYTGIESSLLASRCVATDVKLDEIDTETLPKTFEITQNYPNPFNPSTKVTLQIPLRADVQVEVFNILGQVVSRQTLLDVEAGEHTATIDLANVSSGIYFLRVLYNESEMKIIKMMLLK